MELLNVSKCYFITGTDTGIGKTISCIGLLQSINLAKFTTAGYKPVASGSQVTSKGLRNRDAFLLQKNSSVPLSYESVNPYPFFMPTSPHISSAEEGRPISFLLLSSVLHDLKKKADWVITEGVGGWFTPISEENTFADWVMVEQLPVILVVGIKLGCINHALLTALAVRKAGLQLIGWIANNITTFNQEYTKKYIKILKSMLATPLLGEIPWIHNPETCMSLGTYLDLNALMYLK